MFLFQRRRCNVADFASGRRVTYAWRGTPRLATRFVAESALFLTV